MDRRESSYLLYKLQLLVIIKGQVQAQSEERSATTMQLQSCRECAFGSGPSLLLNHVQYLLYVICNVKYFSSVECDRHSILLLLMNSFAKERCYFLGIILGHFTCKEGSVLSEVSAPVPLSMQKVYRNVFFSYIVLQRKELAL